MNKISKLIHDEYFFAVFNKLIMLVLGLATSALLARYLGAELKGEIAYIQSIVSTGSILLTFGVHQAYPYYRRQNNGKDYTPQYMNSVLFVFLVYTVLSLIVSAVFSKEYVVVACALIMPVFAYSRISGYVLLVEQPNRRNLAISIITTLEVCYLVFLMLFIKRNLFWGVTAITLVELLKSVYFTCAIDFRISPGLIDIKHVFELFRYGFFPMIALLMTTLNYRIDIMMLKAARNISIAQIGIYSIGINIAERALLVSDSVKEILLSKLAKGKGAEEVATVMRICFPVSLITALGIVLIGKPFINILYGLEYSKAYTVTLIDMTGTVFMVFFKMITQFNIVNHKQILNVEMLTVSIIINVIFNLLLVPIWGINGAAVGSVMGYLACAVTFLVYFSKTTGITMRDLVFIKKEDIDKTLNMFKTLEKN